MGCLLNCHNSCNSCYFKYIAFFNTHIYNLLQSFLIHCNSACCCCFSFSRNFPAYIYHTACTLFIKMSKFHLYNPFYYFGKTLNKSFTSILHSARLNNDTFSLRIFSIFTLLGVNTIFAYSFSKSTTLPISS